MTTRRKKARRRTLRPVRPNLGIEAAYRRALVQLIDEMHDAVDHWVRSAYAVYQPAIAQDAAPAEPKKAKGSPAVSIEQLMKELRSATEASGAGRVELPSGAVLIERRTTDKKGKPRYSYEVTWPGARESKRITATQLGDLLVAERSLYETPAASLQEVVGAVSARWQAKFNELAPRLADYFAAAVEDRSSAALAKMLKEHGVSVKFTMTPAQNDVLAATISQNVALIKSIPQKYLTNVEGLVMRSVQTGRDLGSLSKQLRKQYGVTKRRAALIARDQNNKATSALTRARQKELGVTQAVWVHSGAGKEPRPKHLAANGKVYDVTKGLPIGDQGQYVFPGEEINCRCTSRSVIPGF